MRTITKMFLALGLFVFSTALRTPAQTTSEWSDWIPVGSDYPSLDWRVRCWGGSETQVKGTTVSWWDFEFRSRYTMTIDYVYQTRVGDATERKNFWVGPFMGTLQSGQKSDPGYAVLVGPCSQHYSRGEGLWMDVKCVVPAGQDSPCLTNDGEPVRRLELGELNQFNLSKPSGVNNPGKSSDGKLVYFYCYHHTDQEHFLVSKVFSKLTTGPAVDEEKEALNRQFSDWIKSSFKVTVDVGACKPFNTREEASSAREDFMKTGEHPNQTMQFEAVDWPPNGQAP